MCSTYFQQVALLEVLSQVLDQMVLLVYLGQIDGGLAPGVFALDADLLAQEEEEHVDVAADGSQVQVGVALGVPDV